MIWTSDKERIRELEAEVFRLRAELEYVGKLEFDAEWGCYFGSGKHTGLYCALCWDAERKAIHLRKLTAEVSQCPNCTKSIRHP